MIFLQLRTAGNMYIPSKYDSSDHKKNYLFLDFEVYNSDKAVYITKDERGIDFDFQ